MENRGEERDISATQGAERGEEVNALNEALIGVYVCLGFSWHGQSNIF